MIKRIFLGAMFVALAFSLAGQGLSGIARAAALADEMGGLLAIALENSKDVRDKELALEILELDRSLGKLPKGKEEELIAAAREQVCLARLNCCREIQSLLVNILKGRHRLAVLELQDDLYEAEKQACQNMYDAGRATKNDLLAKQRRHDDNRRELNRQRDLLASYEARSAELCGGWQPVISPANLGFPRPAWNEKAILAEITVTDREITELLAKRAAIEAELELAEPYFTPGNELKRLKLEADKIANRLATRKEEIETSLTGYLANIARLKEQSAVLAEGLLQKEEALAEGRLKLEQGLITKRAVESLALELAGRTLEILATELDLYLATMDLYIYIGQGQYWWENVEGGREGLQI